MSIEFLPVLFLMLIAAAIAAAIPILATQLGRQRPDAVKNSPYECGVDTVEPMGKRTNIRFYMTSLLFVVFDIEIAFLYPWAVVVGQMDSRVFVLVEMVLFLGVLLLAYAWLWKKGALEWE